MNKKPLVATLVLALLCSCGLFAAPSKGAEEAVNKALKAADKSPVNAIPLLERAEKEYPFHSGNCEVLYQLGMAYVDAGRFEDANKTFDKLVNRYGKYSDTMVRVDEGKVAKAHVLKSQGKIDEALAFVEKFIKENPKSPALAAARLQQANILVRKDRFDEARKLVEGYANNPSSDFFIPASYVLAEISVRQGDHESAEKRMRAILKTKNDRDIRTSTFYKLGEIYRGCSNFVGAINVYRKIKTPGKTKDDRAQNAGILWEIANTYEGLGHFVEARVGFEGVMKLYPEVEFSTQAWYRAVLNDISAGNMKRAEESYLDFIKKYPKHPDAAPVRLNFAQDLMDTNLFAEAVRHLKAGLEEYPEGEPAENMYFTLGSALLGDKKYAEAEETLTTFAEKFPESELVPQSYLRLAEGYIEQKKYQEAIDYLHKTCDKFPEFGAKSKLEDYVQEIRLTQAATELEAGNFDKAMELAEEVTMESLKSKADYLKADIMVKQGKIAEAAEILEAMAGASTDPELQADILTTLAGIYMNSQDYEKAAATFDKVEALSLPEGSGAKSLAALQKAFCRFNSGDNAGAKAQLEKVLADYPKSDEAGDALYWLAYLAKTSRKNMDAVECYERLVKDYPGHGYAPEAAYECGETRASANKFVEAMESFRKCYDAYPESGFGALSLVRIGEIRVKQKYETESLVADLEAMKTPAARIALLSLPVRAGDREGADAALAKLDSFKMNEELKGYALSMKAGAENLAGAYKKAAQTADAAIASARESGVNLNEALFQRAQAAYLGGDHQEAVPYYDELLGESMMPNSDLQIMALLNRARCALEAKDPGTADKCCQDALQQKPDPRDSAAAVLMRGEACELTATYKQAAQFYKRVTVLYGKLPDYAVPAYRGLIKAYAKLGLKEDLADAKSKFAALYPEEAAK